MERKGIIFFLIGVLFMFNVLVFSKINTEANQQKIEKEQTIQSAKSEGATIFVSDVLHLINNPIHTAERNIKPAYKKKFPIIKDKKKNCWEKRHKVKKHSYPKI